MKLTSELKAILCGTMIRYSLSLENICKFYASIICYYHCSNIKQSFLEQLDLK